MQLLLNRTEDFAVEADIAEPGPPGCEVVVSRLHTLSPTAVVLSVLL